MLSTVVLLSSPASFAQTSDSTPGFPPLDQWKSAVIAGDAATLKAFYSVDPPAEIETNRATAGADADINFWLGLKARSITLEIVRLRQAPDRASVIFKAEAHTAKGDTTNVTDAQGWKKQGEQWRIVGAERTDAPQLAQPSDMKKNLYPDDADAHAEIKEAEQKAASEHKRVLLVFGANWCYDCHVLDLAFHRPDFASVMAGYVVVHVDIGPDGKKNGDVAQQFDTPLNKGVPALAVVASDGKLIVSQKNGEFEDARAMTPKELLEFLNKWKAEVSAKQSAVSN
ncbi:MAG: thioredoxin family protein [Candidatus Sulfotelmatobacter sp.]